IYATTPLGLGWRVVIARPTRGRVRRLPWNYSSEPRFRGLEATERHGFRNVRTKIRRTRLRLRCLLGVGHANHTAKLSLLRRLPGRRCGSSMERLDVFEERGLPVVLGRRRYSDHVWVVGRTIRAHRSRLH